jgi:hypothetical protein
VGGGSKAAQHRQALGKHSAYSVASPPAQK